MKRLIAAPWLLVCACSTVPTANVPGTVTERTHDLPEPERQEAESIAQAPGDEAEPSPTATNEPAATPPEEPAPLPEGTTVLHVGSSTAGALGFELKAELEKRGVKCVLKFKESTFIRQWAGEDLGLRKLVANYNPDLVIVSLGGNEASSPNPGHYAGSIRRIVEIIGERPCLWVGTPKWKALEHTGILDVIQDNIAPCRYFDTDALVPDIEPLPDGVHPTFNERRRWARTLVEWLEQSRDPKGELPWSFKPGTAPARSVTDP